MNGNTPKQQAANNLLAAFRAEVWQLITLARTTATAAEPPPPPPGSSSDVEGGQHRDEEKPQHDHPLPARRRERLLWLDILRSWAVLLVVTFHFPDMAQVGNRIPATIVSWFNMPLFLLISGYTMPSPLPHVRTIATRSARRLLVPYLSWTLLLAAGRVWSRSQAGLSSRTPEYLLRTLMGGARLSGPHLALWFLPVLFGARLLYAACCSGLQHTGHALGVALLCYAASFVEAWWRGVDNPAARNWAPRRQDGVWLDANVTLHAVAFVAIGHAARSWRVVERMSTLAGAALVVVSTVVALAATLALVLGSLLTEDAVFDMRTSWYSGLPLGLHMLLCLAFAVVLGALAQAVHAGVHKAMYCSFPCQVAVALGRLVPQCAMTIMCSHVLLLRGWAGRSLIPLPGARTVTVVLVAMVLHCAIGSVPLLKRLLRGERARRRPS